MGARLEVALLIPYQKLRHYYEGIFFFGIHSSDDYIFALLIKPIKGKQFF